MRRKIISILLLQLIVGSCTQQHNKTEREIRNFQIPVVVQVPTPDTLEFCKAEFLNESWFAFYGKYKFTHSLHFGEHRQRDTTYRKDFISEYSRPRKGDTLNTDGFQIFVDYKTTIYEGEEHSTTGYSFFPVYVANETSRTKVFIGKDSYVFGLQEAIDTSRGGEWRPIESQAFDFCGNGSFGLKVHPGEFVMFLVPKYEGDEKQLMRIILKVGESIYYSQSYQGSFNSKQFNTKKDTWPYDELKRHKAYAIKWLFHGATPKGYDDE